MSLYKHILSEDGFTLIRKKTTKTPELMCEYCKSKFKSDKKYTKCPFCHKYVTHRGNVLFKKGE